jgi:hypothetical protein
VRGVIFFSSTSSSAKFFWYFSQLEPVAEGMAALQAAVGGGDEGLWRAELGGGVVCAWRETQRRR